MEVSTVSISVAGKKSSARRSENQDRVLCRTLDVNGNRGVLLVVADGITRCPYGGSVARWVVDKHLKEDGFEFVGAQAPGQVMVDYLSRLHLQFKEEFSGPGDEDFIASGASLSVVLIHDGNAECLWAGDCPIYISRKRAGGFETELLTKPDRDVHGLLTNCFAGNCRFSPSLRSVKVSVGDVVTVTSDGLTVGSETFDDSYGRKGLSPATLQEMVALVQHGPYWDDVSIVAGQVVSPD